jgi:hypothetical protein
VTVDARVMLDGGPVSLEDYRAAVDAVISFLVYA